MRAVYGLVALAVLLISGIGLRAGCPFLKTWFYLFAWWSYIFFADWLVLKLRGSSRLTSNIREFAKLSLWSVFFWLVFEWFNLFLKNWTYLSVPSNIFVRWFGYALAFATVLPGIFETYDLLETLVKGQFRVRALKNTVKYFPWLTVIGILCLVLPVSYPKYFFPLVWAWAFLLLEPVNYLLAREYSLLYDLERGSFRRPALLLLSGLICGLLWEFWNFWAATKWIYTLPWAWLMEVKLFEMPLPGYLGFPPFALECWSMWIFVSCLTRNRSPWLTGLVILSFYLFMFYQIDAHTVMGFKS